MAYNATYSEADIAPVVIDAIVKVLAVVGTFAVLIGLVFLWKFFKKNTR